MTRVAAALWLLTLLAACGGGGTDATDALGETSAPACDGVWVAGANGRVEAAGGPASGLITVCGSVCFSQRLATDGAFAFADGMCFPAEGRYRRPYLLFHGGDDFTDLHLALVSDDRAALDVVAFDAPLPVVARSEMAVLTLDPGADQTLGDGAGFALSYTAGAAAIPWGGEQLAVARVAPERYPPVAGVETLEALYATAPADVRFDPPAQLRLPLDQALAAGTRVEIVGLGNEETATVYPGELGRVAWGEVSDDGRFVETANGEGLAVLTWLGWRLPQVTH